MCVMIEKFIYEFQQMSKQFTANKLTDLFVVKILLFLLKWHVGEMTEVCRFVS